MTRADADTLLEGAAILCRDTPATFVCLTMRFDPLTKRRQPMKARIRWASGVEDTVSLASLRLATPTGT